VRILANPLLLRALVVLMCAGSAFLLGLLLVRRLRKKITEESDALNEGSASLETLPLQLYNTVIQQLKQQKHELLVQSQAEQHRARTSETFSQAVLTNLSCGVVVFGANGLVKTSNPSARAILGFASVTGMSAENIFRDARVHSEAIVADGTSSEEMLDERTPLVDEIQAVLREGSKRRQVEAEYKTPTGEPRFLSLMISQVPATDGSLLGVTCLINDFSELQGMRRQQELQGEISAEMALQLRTSLTTIAGYAQQLAENRDPEQAKQLATDIAHEAAHLDRSIGGFLTARPVAARAAAAGRAVD
jgi:nitrogen fixation/metabolism regulation signal transduction histidine kinase